MTFEELFLETYTPVLHNQDKFWSSVEIVRATATLTETKERGNYSPMSKCVQFILKKSKWPILRKFDACYKESESIIPPKVICFSYVKICKSWIVTTQKQQWPLWVPA